MRDIIEYLAQTRELDGSDLHLTVGAPPAARVHGELKPLEEFELSPEQCKTLIYDVLSEAQRARLEANYDLDFALQVQNVGRFRGNALYSRGFVEAAFRFVPATIPTLRELGHVPIVEGLSQARSGFILITGMAGMGKTTTLAALAKRILGERSCVMVTIEDPVEYLLEHNIGIVRQRQVGDDVLSFPAALRSALRQDPDIIVVGEMRDHESISLALTAAETGHLVLSTLHSTDAPTALDRLIDAFPGDQQSQIRSQIANSLVAIVSQRLMPRQDASGRVLASEILIANAAVRSVIREGRSERLTSLIQIGSQEGMHTLDESLAHLLLHGHISYENAMANARDPDFVNNSLQAHLQQQEKLSKKR
ncbi:MAG: type IV pilus twitching motility protein PilT [Verrucomicrobiales bacterium]